uniref:CCT-gamma n=1 Tax=Cyprinus carpio TaxID=7962 RepID=A0A8C2G215_CYPCA
MMGRPVLVLSQNIKRESGRKVQIGNITAAKTIADVIRTCLGPRAMMKMLLDPMGGIVMTNDGNAILREIQVQHPAAKSMIEISRTQDEEVGDGTTSVIILAGEMLSVAEHFLEQQMHPTVVISAYRQALDDMLNILKDISTPVDVNNRDMMLKIINSAINTKALSRWSTMAFNIALDAVRTVELEENGRKEIDSKKYAKVEKTDIEITREEDFARILQMEEEYIQQICEDIIRLKPDLIFTEKGISDLAQHYLMKANITAIRRVRKTDNNRIARSCGARIEVERNLQDAMQVCRNVLLDPHLLPGGGAVEMEVSHRLTERSRAMTGVEQWPYRAVAQALEVIPRTLIQNCGASAIRVLTALRAKHTQEGNTSWGINGETGTLAEMEQLGICEPLAVKAQTYKTAVETAILLLRIDDIVSGHKKKGDDQAGGAPMEDRE